MSLDIGFITNIHTVIITESIKCRIIGVIASADGVKVVLLENLNILLSTLLETDNFALIGVVFMSIDTANSSDSLAIN